MMSSSPKLFVLLISVVALLTVTAATASATAGNCPNALVRLQQDATALPDCRAYEQVSPTDKNSTEITAKASARQVATTGDAAVFATNGGAFAGTPSAPIIVTYLARRTASGWATTAITPPHDPEGLFATSGTFNSFSADLEQAIVPNDRPSLTADAPPNVRNLYLRNNDDGRYALVTTSAPPGDPFYQAAFADVSADYDDVLFEAPAALTPDAPAGVTNLYQWHDGTVRFMGILPDGQPALGGSVSGSTPAPSQGTTPKRRTISADGSSVIFSDVATGQLYLRVNATTTTHVSASQRAVPDPNGPRPVTFQGATLDASQIFFTSSDKLTDDATTGFTGAGVDLYRYDSQSATLTDISVDANSLDADGAGVQGVVAVSDDGSHVYFVATGQIVAGEGTPGAPNLYLRTPDGVRFVMTLDPLDSGYWAQPTLPLNDPITPDGTKLVLTSYASVDGAHTGGFSQVYAYDANADTARCLSCPGDGTTPTGDAVTRTDSVGTGRLQSLAAVASDDGRRVYFESPDALLPQDTNGKVDVYQDEDGRLSLISSGQSTSDSHFFGISRSADDVFLMTREGLVDADDDDFADLYTARVDGGFPTTPGVKPCVGEDCQARPSIPPALVAAGSISFVGPGNPPREGSTKRTPPGKPKLSKVKTVYGTSTTLKVQVPGKGQIVTSGSGLSRSTRSATKAGTYAMPVRLSTKARQTLARRHRMVIRVTVRFTPAGGTSSSVQATMTFKPAKRSKPSKATPRRATAALSTDARKER